MSLAQKLGILYPIIQAPMAGVATPELAAAVSNAGALGSIGIGASSVSAARTMIENTQKLTSRPFNVNVFCHERPKRDLQQEQAWLQFVSPLFKKHGASLPQELREIYGTFNDQTLALLLALKPPVVSFHFGVPDFGAISKLKEHGIFTIATATSLEEAQLIESRGVDAVIAQGYEAGGHRGTFDSTNTDERLSTFVLASLLLQKTGLPVIAAGGIMDGRAIRAYLSLGVAAVQLGTAFVACPESAANEAYRRNLLEQPRTLMTSAFSGRPARGLRNEFTQFCEQPNAPPPAAYPLAYDLNKQLTAAGAASSAHWAGQGAPLTRTMPASELVSTLVKEAGL